jgi:hypothetical protein
MPAVSKAQLLKARVEAAKGKPWAKKMLAHTSHAERVKLMHQKKKHVAKKKHSKRKKRKG